MEYKKKWVIDLNSITNDRFPLWSDWFRSLINDSKNKFYIRADIKAKISEDILTKFNKDVSELSTTDTLTNNIVIDFGLPLDLENSYPQNSSILALSSLSKEPIEDQLDCIKNNAPLYILSDILPDELPEYIDNDLKILLGNKLIFIPPAYDIINDASVNSDAILIFDSTKKNNYNRFPSLGESNELMESLPFLKVFDLANGDDSFVKIKKHCEEVRPKFIIDYQQNPQISNWIVLISHSIGVEYRSPSLYLPSPFRFSSFKNGLDYPLILYSYITESSIRSKFTKMIKNEVVTEHKYREKKAYFIPSNLFQILFSKNEDDSETEMINSLLLSNHYHNNTPIFHYSDDPFSVLDNSDSSVKRCSFFLSKTIFSENPSNQGYLEKILETFYPQLSNNGRSEGILYLFAKLIKHLENWPVDFLDRINSESLDFAANNKLTEFVLLTLYSIAYYPNAIGDEKLKNLIARIHHLFSYSKASHSNSQDIEMIHALSLLFLNDFDKYRQLTELSNSTNLVARSMFFKFNFEKTNIVNNSYEKMGQILDLINEAKKKNVRNGYILTISAMAQLLQGSTEEAKTEIKESKEIIPSIQFFHLAYESVLLNNHDFLSYILNEISISEGSKSYLKLAHISLSLIIGRTDLLLEDTSLPIEHEDLSSITNNPLGSVKTIFTLAIVYKQTGDTSTVEYLINVLKKFDTIQSEYFLKIIMDFTIVGGFDFNNNIISWLDNNKPVN
jgi:hypothetical protein